MQPCRWRRLNVTFSWSTNRIVHCQLIAPIAIGSRLSGWHESPECVSGSLAFGNLSGNVTRAAVKLGSIHEQTRGIGRPADQLVDLLVVACAAVRQKLCASDLEKQLSIKLKNTHHFDRMCWLRKDFFPAQAFNRCDPV